MHAAPNQLSYSNRAIYVFCYRVMIGKDTDDMKMELTEMVSEWLERSKYRCTSGAVYLVVTHIDVCPK